MVSDELSAISRIVHGKLEEGIWESQCRISVRHWAGSLNQIRIYVLVVGEA